MAMVEEQIFVDELKAKYLETKLRVKRLEEEKEYAIGCIVRKGPQKQYCYWQRNENGKQVQRYLPPNQVESVEKRILAAKENRQKLMDLKHFLSTLKKLLRSIGIQGEEIVADYEKRQVAKEKEDIHLRMAQEIASTKRYAENYRHLTDRGEYVASKSELIIANTLYAYKVKYEYEREIEIEGKVFKPDFTVWRADGTMLLWEHAGLMDDPEYAWDFQQKLRMYHIGGYKQSLNLIVTYDSNGTFNAAEVRRMVEVFRLV